MSKTLRIFALGGNEISPTGQVDKKTGKLEIPDLDKQWQRTANTCSLIADIIKNDPDNLYILTHGNGPQVGNILLRAENALDILHPLTLDVCGADSQGAIGYMLSQLRNFLKVQGVDKDVAGTITQTIVDSNDPAFKDPTKFIGSAMTKEEAEQKAKELGWQIKLYKKNEAGTEIWRRVVPSPIPKDIAELSVIENNLASGVIPITVGGGGIPVARVEPTIEGDDEVYTCQFGIKYKRPHQNDNKPINILKGVEAVVDKDLASALLGRRLKERAEERGEKLETELVIFTDVDGAKLNFQQPDQIDLRHLTLTEIKDLNTKGVFPGGSMGPKIQAIINFLEGGGSRAYISKVEHFQETLEGKRGTTFVSDK